MDLHFELSVCMCVCRCVHVCVCLCVHVPVPVHAYKVFIAQSILNITVERRGYLGMCGHAFPVSYYYLAS